MNERKSLIKHLDFVIADLLISQVSYLLGCLIWIGVNDRTWWELRAQYWHQAALLLLCVAVEVLVTSPYKDILKRNKYQEVAASARHSLSLLILYIIVIYFAHEGGNASRLIMVFTWIIYFAASTAFRLFWKRVLRKRCLSGNSRRAGNAMILVTDRARAAETIRGLRENAYAPFFLKAVFLSDYDPLIDEGTFIEEVPVSGDAEEAIRYSANHWVDEATIGFAHDSEKEQEAEQHFERMGITTHRILLKLPEAWHTGTEGVERYGNYLVATHVLRYVPLWKWGVKRFVDIVGGLVGLALTGIIFLFVAPQIYHADKGPVIYSSTRIGRNGRPFKFYKFRSMYQNADEIKKQLMEQNKMQGLMFKVDHDPRILPGIGEFIRKTSLDEFPQFWNVLKGDMSLVGTRPPTVDEWEQYGEEHRIRMTQRPGITGIWQVSGRSQVTDFSEVVKMDERYIETWTLGMDFMIIMKTIGKVLKREGAE